MNLNGNKSSRDHLGTDQIQADFRQYLVDDGKADRTVQSYVTDVIKNVVTNQSIKSHLHKVLAI